MLVISSGPGTSLKLFLDKAGRWKISFRQPGPRCAVTTVFSLMFAKLTASRVQISGFAPDSVALSTCWHDPHRLETTCRFKAVSAPELLCY